MRLLSTLLVFLIAVFAIVCGIGFALLNSEKVLVHYYTGSQELPVSLLVLGALMVGFILGWFSALPNLIRARLRKH